MKNGNLYQELKTAKRESAQIDAQRDELIIAMEKELAAARKAIKAKYAPTLEPLKEASRSASSKVWNIGREYHDYSCFNNCYMVNSMATFMTYVEGERFVVHPVNDANQNKVIMRERVALEYDDMDDATLMKFVANGDCVLLDQGYSNTVDLFDYVGEPNFMFGKYDYLKEFANRIVEYRKSRGLKGYFMSTEQIYEFMAEFLASHKELTQKNKDRRNKMLYGYIDEECIGHILPPITEEDDDVTRGCAKLEMLRREKDV